MLYKERCETKRQCYLAKLKDKSNKNLIYIDESGIDTFLSRDYGRAPRGIQVNSEKSGKRFARESFVAGLKNGKIVAPICYQGTMDKVLFNFWLANFLLPATQPGDILIMDNATFHKSDDTKKLITDAKCELIFLPPYSPDLNPIEKCWANLKMFIKRNVSKFSSLSEAVDSAFRVDHLNFN